MVNSLSSLADNIKEGLNKGKYENYKSDLIVKSDRQRCLIGILMCRFQQNYDNKFDNDFPKRFESTYIICDGKIKKKLSDVAER